MPSPRIPTPQRAVLLTLAIALLTLSARAASSIPTPVTADYAGPQRVDLSGIWDFRIDANREGETAQWFNPKTLPKYQRPNLCLEINSHNSGRP